MIDPSASRAGFAMNVIALLPYMLHHYEDANALCIQAAENIAQVSQVSLQSLSVLNDDA